MVADRADAAQPLHHDRNLPIGAAFDKSLEAAKFDDVQADLMDLVVVVEQDRDLAVTFDAGDRIDGDAAQFFGMGGGFESGHVASPLNRNAKQSDSSRRGMRRDEIGQIFPDRVARRRTAGNEIVDPDDFVDRIDLVQQQRQFRIVGDTDCRRGMSP